MQLQRPTGTGLPTAAVADTRMLLAQPNRLCPAWISDALLFAADAIIVTNRVDEILFFNQAAEMLFGYRSADLENRDLGALLPTWREHLAKMHLRRPMPAVTTGSIVEVVGHRRDGSTFTAEMSVSVTFSDGAQIRILILRAVSTRKSDRDDLHAKRMDEPHPDALLLRELRHRVKNNFQVLLSILHLEKTHALSSEANAVLANMETRISALNGVNAQLLITDEKHPIALAPYIRQLVGALAESFQRAPSPVVFRLALDQIDMPTKNATHLGLLINEAVTNTFKHAVPRGATEITIALTDRDDHLLVAIGDNGPGSNPVDQPHQGGTELMRALTRQLGATIERAPGTKGVRYLICVPMRLTRE